MIGWHSTVCLDHSAEAPCLSTHLLAKFAFDLLVSKMVLFHFSKTVLGLEEFKISITSHILLLKPTLRGFKLS